ncbi:beta-lactamase family protein [Streptomyces sp. Go40/10]|uniref:serine hydrolase domain-containing protein n=1 Tax=Streptomyces sp. Go40/10 TaxID=2825844 RepID=UPI001E3505EF|nr:serine hydrolase domain-containing protein [Streptomyces sp. Go40/10]UFR00503.1 beta-lactamase family protein [Streptomyces sp. Go40/10]
MANPLPTSAFRRRTGLTAVALACLLTAAPAAAAQPPPATSRPCGPDTALSRSVHHLVAKDRIAGAAVLVTGAGPDAPCARRTVTDGVADLRTGRPMNSTDRLRVGSVTKTFTATVVLQLAAERRLSLDAPVERYLPGLIRAGGHDGRRITVRQLLQHTSGLPDYLEAPEWEHPERVRYRHFEPRRLIARALRLPRPEHPWHYATTNYLVAGLIVRAVTGHSPESEITRRIIAPLGLHDTYWPGDESRIRGPHSHSYFTAEDGRRTDGTAWNTTFGGVGGALVSTPADLTRFATALFGGRLLPAPRLAEMRRTVAADPDRLWPGARYGLGLISSPLSCGGSWWGHAGTVPGGHRALVATGPDGRTVAVALTEVPATLQAERDFLDVVDTALCEAPSTERTPA